MSLGQRHLHLHSPMLRSESTPASCWLRRRAPCLFVAALFVSGCQTPDARLEVVAAPRIWDVRTARFVSESALIADVAAARYRLLGEVHDNPEHHRIRARLILAIAATGARPAVVMEQ